MSGSAVTPPPTPGKPPRARVGEFNHLIINIGARESGKSVYGCIRARQLQAEAGGALVVGHSLGHRVPSVLPNGTRIPVEYHRNIEQLERAQRRRPNNWHIIGPPLADEDQRPDLPRSSADDLIHWTVRLSYAIRSQAWLRSDRSGWRLTVPDKGADFTGLEATPIIIMLDEGAAVGGAAGGDRGKGEGTDWFREILISLRHCHVGIILNIQSANMKSWRLLEQATEVNCFQVVHQYAINSLRDAGASEEQIEQVKHLDLYERVTFYPVAKRKAGNASAVPPAV